MIRTVTVLSLLLTFSAAPGLAQVPRGYAPVAPEVRERAANSSAWRLQTGVEALQSKNFVVAETVFDEVLKRDNRNPSVNFMMGVTKMSLGKWPEARRYLELAVRGDPKNPDPKSRLGVTLIKLGEMDAAMDQRAALVKMSEACKGQCRLAEYISGGIAMIDSARPPAAPPQTP